MSELWQLGLGWDEAIPQLMHTKWLKFREQIPLLQEFKAPRRVVLDASKYIQIHGFADASQRAYGAVVYVRSIDHKGNIDIHLLCSKSRVAPAKTISIARLELCAAKLLADLVELVKGALKVALNDTIYWSDSTIVLAWIAAKTSPKDVFLANRIAAIQRISTHQQWRHIPTKQNPADIISRGVLPEELLHCTLWFKGPAFLKSPKREWPAQVLLPTITESPKEAMINLVSTTESNKLENIFRDIDHKNSYGYLQRVVAFILRFGYNCKQHSQNKKRLRKEGRMWRF